MSSDKRSFFNNEFYDGDDPDAFFWQKKPSYEQFVNPDNFIGNDTIIPPGTEVAGEFVSMDHVVMLGSVKAKISSDKDVRILKGCSFKGAVTAEEIFVDGDASGILISNKCTYVSNTGSVRGRIVTRKLAASDLAYVDCQLFLPAIDRKKQKDVSEDAEEQN